MCCRTLRIASVRVGLVLLTSVFCSVFTTGCTTTSLSQVAAFSSATSTLAADAKDAYQLLDESTVERKIYDAAAHPTEVKVAEETFKTILAAKQERLTVRMAVLSKLGDYADAVHTLATADFRKDVDDGAKNLYGALEGLKSSYKNASGKDLGISDGDLGIISTAVDAIGAVIVEAKRREAIKVIVNKTDGAIQDASKLLSDELGGFADIVSVDLREVESNMIDAYNKDAASMTFEARLDFLEKIRKADDARVQAKSFLEQTAKAAAQMGKTHATLKKNLDHDKFASGDLAQDVGQLVDFATSIKQFHDSLTSKQ